MNPSYVMGALIGISFAIFYYYIDTLSLSEIVGKTDSKIVNIGVKLFDFGDKEIRGHQ